MRGKLLTIQDLLCKVDENGKDCKVLIEEYNIAIWFGNVLIESIKQEDIQKALDAIKTLVDLGASVQE